MKIGFIGAGRVGFSLAKWLSINYHNVCGIYSKNLLDAKELKEFSISEYYDDINELLMELPFLLLMRYDALKIYVI